MATTSDDGDALYTFAMQAGALVQAAVAQLKPEVQSRVLSALDGGAPIEVTLTTPPGVLTITLIDRNGKRLEIAKSWLAPPGQHS